MAAYLPSVLGETDLPRCELFAARLDGEVFRIDDCFSPIDEIEQCSHRARALLPLAAPRMIAERQSAAWVLGARARPPAIHQFCTAAQARTAPRAGSRTILREVVIAGGELFECDGLRVTTPLRTVIDLARSDDFGDPEREIVRVLLGLGALPVEDCIRAMAARRNLPGRRRAVRRLHDLLSRR
jgi:hypothetical protein